MDAELANLPGIDNGPDVYETKVSDWSTGVNGDSQNTNLAEDDKGSAIDVDAARAKFSSSLLKPSRQTFADSTSTGYDIVVLPADLNSNSAHSWLPVLKETHQQRLARITAELDELEHQLDEDERTPQTGDQQQTAQTTASIASELRGLYQRLQNVRVRNGPADGSAISAKMITDIQQRLGVAVNEATAIAMPVTTSTKSGKDAVGGVTYELYYRPEHARELAESRVRELERRLALCEKVIGIDSAQVIVSEISAALSIPKSSSLRTALEALMTRMSLLNQDSIVALEALFARFSESLDTVSKKSSDMGALNELTELYETVKRWDHVAQALPALLDRLRTLQSLHVQASEYGQTLAQITSRQAHTVALLESQKKMLELATASIDENMKTITKNFEVLEGRLKSVEL